LTSKDTKNKNSGLINKYIYGYNRVGMKMFEQRGHDNNKGDAYAYDAVYRLTGVKFNSPEPANPATALFEKRWSSQMDKVDNILKIVQQTADGATEITTTIEGVNAQLNQYTRFDEWGLSYDLNGNTTQRGTQHFTYDYRNRIVSVQGLGVAVKYNYDPFNRRVEKILGSGTVKYLYDGDQVIEERDGNDNVLKQYVWGNGVDELIAIYVKDGDTFKAYYPHTNGSGSITAITNDQGEVIERVTYDVYGMPTFLDANNQPLANNQSTIGNTYLFQGRQYDKETNLYYYRARYYDPIMGRFLQTDPMGYEDSMNLYQGFNMNPVNFMDPFGLERVIVNSYMMNGGPKTMKPGDAHNKYPTFAGQFKIYSIGKHTSPQYYPMFSSIPWGSPLRLNNSNQMEVQINGVWKNIKDVIPDASVRPSVGKVASQFMKFYGTDTNALEKFGFKVSSNQKFATSFYLPDTWIFNDFGHVTVKMYSDNNNNGKLDPGEENREYFHPTPDIEALISTGTNPNDIYERTLGESHGCIHVKPTDIDEMIAKKYMSIGNQVVIHSYDDDPGVLGLRSDPSGQAPFMIHVFPGKKKILIEGEK